MSPLQESRKSKERTRFTMHV